MRSRNVPTVVNFGPVGPAETGLAIRVPPVGNEAANVVSAIPELETYLRARFPKVRAVRFAHQNPRTTHWCMSYYQPEAWILIALLNPLTQKIMSDVADDAYKWLKKRFKIKKGRGKHTRRIRKTRRER